MVSARDIHSMNCQASCGCRAPTGIAQLKPPHQVMAGLPSGTGAATTPKFRSGA